jgi:hypothetical protein
LDFKSEAICFGQPGRFQNFTTSLVEQEWLRLLKRGICPCSYQTLSFLFLPPQLSTTLRIPLNRQNHNGTSIFIEYSDAKEIKQLLREQQLQEKHIQDNEIILVKNIIEESLSVIQLVPSIAHDIFKLVQAIWILNSPGEEYDVSYSHPMIPFSIFISITSVRNEIGKIRIAESIVHEAMHLKLSLIEKAAPLIKEQDSISKLYSPWKLQMRPVQGVLHGLFVFKMLLLFYQELKSEYAVSSGPHNFILKRMLEIKEEIKAVKNLKENSSLTTIGSDLVKELLDVELL